MADEIVVRYRLDMGQTDAEVADFEKDLRSAERTGKKTFGTVTNEAKKTGIAVQKTTKEVETFGSKLSNLANNLPFVGQIKQVVELGGAVAGLGGAAEKSSAGFRILKAAIIGTGIGALVIAIIALISYFKRTDEGAAKLSGVMSALGAAADIVTGLFVSFGDALVSASTSMSGFKDLMSGVLDFLTAQVTVRVTAIINVFKELGNLLAAPFDDSNALETYDRLDSALADLVTGVEDTNGKINDFVDNVSEAAKAAYDWEIAMDALEDKIRDNSIVIAENDAAITKLIIASKNKNIQDEKSLEFLDKASVLEKENLRIALENETARLKLIQARNKRESDSINQDIANGDKRRSIDDKLAQEEVDQINKITALKMASDNLQEKINNRKDAKLEEIFQNQLKRAGEEEIRLENIAKERFLTETISAQELEDELYKIKLDGLNNQKALLLADSRDIIDIDKAILDLELQNRLKSDKEKAALQKSYDEAAAKEQKERLAKEAKYKADFDKDQEEKQKAHEDKIRLIKQAGIEVLETLASGFADISNQRRQNELNAELDKTQEETDFKTKSLQKQLDEGLISQEVFNAKKTALDQKQKAVEAGIKRKQFEANKNAKLVEIAINTAAAVAQTIATLGIPAGLVGAAVAIALGAAQAAIVQAQPTPKFKDGVIDLKGKGTGTSDSIPAMLSRGESVMTAKETARHKGFFQAIRSGKEKDYISKNYVSPELERIETQKQRAAISRREQQERALYNIANNQGTDTSRMERLLKKNGKVEVSNIPDLAKELSKQNAYNNPFYK